MSDEQKQKVHITPSIQDIEFARRFLIAEAQKIHHPEEYEALARGENISEKSSLVKLNPHLKKG